MADAPIDSGPIDPPGPDPYVGPPADIVPDTRGWTTNECDNAVVGGGIRPPEAYPCDPPYPCAPGGVAIEPRWRPGFTECVTLHPTRSVDLLGVGDSGNDELCSNHFGAFVVDAQGWTRPFVGSTPYAGVPTRKRWSLGRFVVGLAGGAIPECPPGWTCGVIGMELPRPMEGSFFSDAPGCESPA